MVNNMTVRSLILNTSHLVSKLRRLGGEIELMEGKHFVTDILEDLFSCFTNAKLVHRKLSEFITEISQGKYEYGFCLLDQRFAQVIWELGIEVFQQLKHAHAFLPDGTLPFYYFPISDKHFNDILLLRLYDLPQPDYDASPSLAEAFASEYARLRPYSG
jgi:hypothetical protein